MSDELDRILSQENEIVPSSGFIPSVMEAVRKEAVALPPIPFPWKRALPVLVLGGIALLSTMAVLVGLFLRSGNMPMFPSSLPLALPASWRAYPEAGWILAAALMTLVSVRFSFRLAIGKR